jgi:hypothetical protein
MPHARMLHRPAMVVPGPVTSAQSVGCHADVAFASLLSAAWALKPCRCGRPSATVYGPIWPSDLWPAWTGN